MNGIALALFCGFIYYIGLLEIGYTLSEIFCQPLFIGFVLGIVLGDVKTGLVIGGSLELIYLGIIYPGGVVPSDSGMAAIVIIPIAIQTGMDPNLAVTLAVPFGVLGSFLWQLKKTINSAFAERAETYARAGNVKSLRRLQVVGPMILVFVIGFIPVTLATYFGADFVDALLKYIPEWAMTGLSVAGGALPALGFAITILTIGKKEFMPYFILGYFLVQYLQIDTMAMAIFGGCLAMIIFYNDSKKSKKVEA